MGPVTPLLAVYGALKKIDLAIEGVWIGTRHGPERVVVEAAGFRFYDLPVVRCVRSVSVEWLLFPFRFFCALYKAAQIIRREKPDVVGSAGGYTAVPVVLAAKLFHVPAWVHSQDVEVTLTTRLTAPLSDRLTIAWQQSARELGSRAHVVGNPVRHSILLGSKERAQERFSLDAHKPTVVIFGGGTGAAWLNAMTGEIVERLLVRASVIHITGTGKRVSRPPLKHYAVREFLREEMADAFAAADVVVCRAGMGTITELAALSKAAILLPLPNSAQEKNAAAVEDACVVLDQRTTSSDELLRTIVNLLEDEQRRRELGQKMHSKLKTNVADELAVMLQGMIK